MHLDVFSDVVRDARQRVRLRGEAAQAAVHIQHEVVEVRPLQLRQPAGPTSGRRCRHNGAACAMHDQPLRDPVPEPQQQTRTLNSGGELCTSRSISMVLPAGMTGLPSARLRFLEARLLGSQIRPQLKTTARREAEFGAAHRRRRRQTCRAPLDAARVLLTRTCRFR